MCGDIADDIVNGFQCSHCGICFEAEHGHPVLCHDCYDDETPQERSGLPRAYLKELGEDDDEPQT